MAAVVAAVAIVVLVVTLVLASDSDPIPDAAPSPSATPSPSPTPSPTPPPPIAGEADRELIPVDRDGTGLFNSAVGTETDIAAADAFTTALRSWLDDHLTQLQRGSTTGRLSSSLVQGAPADTIDAVTTALVAADRPPRSVHYAIRLYVAGAPQYALVRVRVSGEDGTDAEADYTFVPSQAGEPIVVAAGPTTKPAPPPPPPPSPAATPSPTTTTGTS